MIVDAVDYVLQTLFHLFVLAVLTRFYAQAFRAPFRNPIANFVVALTDFAVKPMRRIIPGVMGLDLASLLVAWFAEILLQVSLYALKSWPLLALSGFWPAVVLLALVMLLKLSIYLLIAVLIGQAILSWMSQYHPMRPFFDALSRPFLRPLQRVMPLVGGWDLSPLILLIVLQVVLMVPIAWLEAASRALILRISIGG